MTEEPKPNTWTIHRRFATALLRAALAGTGRLHVDYRVDTQRRTIRYFEPRDSANDPDLSPQPDSDPSKQLVRSLLEQAGMRAVEVEVGGAQEVMDLYFIPSRRKLLAPELLARMTRKNTILTLLHRPPELEDAREALRLAFAVWELRRRKSTARKARAVMPQTWIICTDMPKALPGLIGARLREEWPAGFYVGPPALPVHIVALRKVTISPDTLLLRLLGTGEILESALAEQAGLPADAPVRRAVRVALAAVCPAEGEPVPLETATKDPVMRACLRAYRRCCSILC
jgi:hypothetical protein